MKALIKTPDPVLMSAADSALKDAGIQHVILYDHGIGLRAPGLGGAVSALMVADEEAEQAKTILREAFGSDLEFL